MKCFVYRSVHMRRESAKICLKWYIAVGEPVVDGCCEHVVYGVWAKSMQELCERLEEELA